MELMKLKEAMGRVLLSFCAPSCGVVSWCRSLFDDSGLSGSCFCQWHPATWPNQKHLCTYVTQCNCCKRQPQSRDVPTCACKIWLDSFSSMSVANQRCRSLHFDASGCVPTDEPLHVDDSQTFSSSHLYTLTSALVSLLFSLTSPGYVGNRASTPWRQ